VECRLGDQDANLLRGIDLVIPSPGVPRTHPTLALACARGVPVFSEIELAARMLACPILAVTGTNGKSTTTTLLGAMCEASGLRTFVGGNLGTPLVEACDIPDLEVAVVEVSSFQLEWVSRFRPRVSVLLNLTPDHLDRYPDIAEYGRTKARLLAQQGSQDVAVLNREDPWVWDQRHHTRAAAISFGREPVEFGTFPEGDAIVCWGLSPTPRRITLRTVRLRGAHNLENMMAAVTAASVWGIPENAIQSALDKAVSLPHRLELVREYRGVRYFNDSKGTNVGAVEKSLSSFDGNVILLAGGYDKGGDFRRMLPILKDRAKRLILFGAAAAKIEQQLNGSVPYARVSGLGEAIRMASGLAAEGDVVLLSPGCASFDEFTDYAARGRYFREIVEGL
jgi:UDP-N-acetylmuramoylalanine--D-glutamate ligase